MRTCFINSFMHSAPLPTNATPGTFIAVIRESMDAAPEQVRLNATTELGAKAEARGLQKMLGHEQRRILLMQRTATHWRAAGELVGHAKEWRA